MKTILFQGDSITDCFRLRDGDSGNSDDFLGMGYPTFVKGELGLENPGEFRFLNRAYSGDRIVDVYARYKRDIVNHKPDYMSILVGINDVAHEADMKNGVNAERFEQLYGMLLDDLLKDLPDLKIMLLEPFYLPGKGTVSTKEKPEKAEYFAHEMPVRASIVKRLAREYKAEFVPLQKKISAAADIMGNETVLIDGVHPSAIGHEIIAREWITHFKNMR